MQARTQLRLYATCAHQSTRRLTRSHKPQLRRKFATCLATLNSDTGAEQPASSENAENSNLKQTMADLDALLGIVEEEKEEVVEQKDEQPPTNLEVGISPDVLKVIAEAEAKRVENRGLAQDPEVTKKVNDSFARIVEQAKKLAKDKEDKSDSTAGEQAIKKEFESLLVVLTGPKGMEQEQIKKITDEAFGPTSFWVTSTSASPEYEGGLLVKGNFRAPQEKVFAEVCKKINDMYGDKYIVRLTEDYPDQDAFDNGSDPRTIFQILPRELAMPPSAAGWLRGASVLLLLLTFGSAMQLGVAANLGLLPKETLTWLANPANVNADVLPPGLENFDPVPFLESAVRVAGVSLLPQLTHEIGHTIMAGIRGLKTGPSFLIPNSQLATFGSITQLKSFAKNRTELFDFAAAGLISGGVVSLGLFIAGLIASQSGGGAEAGLVPVPTQLFQGSLLLGGLSQLALGSDAVTKANVFVSPMLIGGWCGLVMTALNALPVGNLDGGRTMLSAYGKGTLAFTSLASYIGLGLGLLGSSLALPFGLYVLICQRESERNVQDEVTEIDNTRKAVALALVVFATLILIPGVNADDLTMMNDPANFI